MSSTDLTLRPGGEDDVEAVADLYTLAREAAVPAMPPSVHTNAEDRAWVAGRVASGSELWVAERDSALVGYLLLTRGWVDHLFVRPDVSREGIGTALLDLAKGLRPDGFGLWVFASNTPALAFYRAHGLVELERTDGSGNEERSPDVRMAWPGERPLAFLRAEMDDVDQALAAVLVRRATVAAAIQRHKPVGGHAGRDPRREEEIARRMAELAPCFPAESWRRIMHEVISAGLDALDDPT